MDGNCIQVENERISYRVCGQRRLIFFPLRASLSRILRRKGGDWKASRNGIVRQGITLEIINFSEDRSSWETWHIYRLLNTRLYNIINGREINCCAQTTGLPTHRSRVYTAWRNWSIISSLHQPLNHYRNSDILLATLLISVSRQILCQRACKAQLVTSSHGYQLLPIKLRVSNKAYRICDTSKANSLRFSWNFRYFPQKILLNRRIYDYSI